MDSFIEQIEKRMTPQDKRMLKDIYAPEVVAVPVENAWRNLCVMPDGRIRYYGAYRKKSLFDADFERCYIESCDGGLSWKKYFVEDKDALREGIYVPFLDKYIAIEAISSEIPGDDVRDNWIVMARAPGEKIDEKYYISKDNFCIGVLALQKKNRIIVIGHEKREGQPYVKSFFMVANISDDGGKTWKKIQLPEAPYHEKKWPHKGERWQANFREPCLEELEDGTVVLMARTAQDFHYCLYSYDHGDTWTEPKATTFHSTSTNNVIKRLSDGRLLFFWCNTQSMPEMASADGDRVDAFTNRDVNHVAISEDGGKTWLGFRELALSDIRCNSDFRSAGGPECCNDKSVHQAEIIELPFNKLLIAYGQHFVARRMVIVDIDWIYEKERHEDFIHGLASLSTQSYVKSILGGYKGTPETASSNVGHCSYNRISGALLVPHPNGRNEALSIASNPDERLLTPICGAVWNYPAARKGEITLSAKLGGAGLRISLLDYWRNPSDDSTSYLANYSVVLRPDMHPEGEEFSKFLFEFDCDKGTVKLSCGEYLCLEGKISGNCPHGLCYLHMQSVNADDTVGSLVERIDFKAVD